MEAFGYKSIAFGDSGDAVIYLMDGRELSVPGHVAEGLQRARAVEGLPPIPVTRATSPEPITEHSDIAVPDKATPRQWKVTICGRIEEVTDDPRFPALFEAALSSDLEADVIQFNEPSLPHTTSAVLKISEVSNQAAEAIGLAILRRNLRVVALAIIGDEPYGWAAEVKSEPLSPNSK
jgi:hypothetical protein